MNFLTLLFIQITFCFIFCVNLSAEEDLLNTFFKTGSTKEKKVEKNVKNDAKKEIKKEVKTSDKKDDKKGKKAVKKKEEEDSREYSDIHRYSERYIGGNYLIYDCKKRHFACVDKLGFKKCQRVRKIAKRQALSLLYCAPLKKFDTYEECVREHYRVMHDMGKKYFCINDVSTRLRKNNKVNQVNKEDNHNPEKKLETTSDSK